MVDGETTKAIELIRQGNIAEGAKILSAVIKSEPDNQAAWLWMSACVVEKEKKVFCLEKVYKLNPGNAAARKGLEALGYTLEPVAPREVPPPAAPVVEDNQTNGFSYRDLSAAMGKRPQEDSNGTVKETPLPQPKVTVSAVEDAAIQEQPTFETQSFSPIQVPQDEPEQPTMQSAETEAKAFMMEDFSFSSTSKIEEEAPQPKVESPKPVRRRRRKTNWLLVAILGLLIVLLLMVAGAKIAGLI